MRYVDRDGTPVTVYQPNEIQGGIMWGLRQAYHDLGLFAGCDGRCQRWLASAGGPDHAYADSQACFSSKLSGRSDLRNSDQYDHYGDRFRGDGCNPNMVVSSVPAAYIAHGVTWDRSRAGSLSAGFDRT